jgi:hypothetical protein
MLLIRKELREAISARPKPLNVVIQRAGKVDPRDLLFFASENQRADPSSASADSG